MPHLFFSFKNLLRSLTELIVKDSRIQSLCHPFISVLFGTNDVHWGECAWKLLIRLLVSYISVGLCNINLKALHVPFHAPYNIVTFKVKYYYPNSHTKKFWSELFVKISS